MNIKYIKRNETQHLNIQTSPFEILYRLEGYLFAQLLWYRGATMSILVLALSGPLWFGTAVLLGIWGKVQLAAFFLLLMPGCMSLALVLWLCLHFLVMPNAAEKRHLLNRIRFELQRRGKESFSFASNN